MPSATASGPGPHETGHRPARRHAGLIAVIIALVLLLSAAFVAADRLTAGYVERSVGSGVATQLGLSDPPQVVIHGFPFLTQLATRRYERVDLSATDVTVGADPSLTLASCQVSLTDVRLESSSYRVAALTGTATLGWDQLTTLTGQSIAYDAASGRATVTVSAAVLGTALTVTLSGRPTLDVAQQRITFADGQIVVAGTALPPSVAAVLISEFLPPVDLHIPYGITAAALHLDATGIGLDVAGTDLTIPR